MIEWWFDHLPDMVDREDPYSRRLEMFWELQQARCEKMLQSIPYVVDNSFPETIKHS